MTRRVYPRWLVVAAGLAVALTGCATRSTMGAGTDAAGAGTPGAGGAVAGAGGAGGISGAGADGARGLAPYPALPSPSEFSETSTLRDVHFDFDRAAVRPEDGRVLDANARWLVAHPGTLILIEGHADERGTNEYNLALGENRARITREQLVARGVAASRITLVSYGEERPMCQQSTEGCWAQNRRAHFLVKTSVTVGALRQ